VTQVAVCSQITIWRRSADCFI